MGNRIGCGGKDSNAELGEDQKRIIKDGAGALITVVAALQILMSVICVGVEIVLYIYSYNLCYQTYVPCGSLAFGAIALRSVKKSDPRGLRGILTYGCIIIIWNTILFLCYFITVLLGHVLMSSTPFFSDKGRATAETHHVVDPILGVGLVAAIAQIGLGSVYFTFGKMIRGGCCSAQQAEPT